MTDLVAFLNARLDEDAQEARAAFSNQADPEHGWGIYGLAVTPNVGVIHEDVQRAHVAKWHPGRVLADVTAKRAILDSYATTIRIRDEAAARIRASFANPAKIDLDEWDRSQLEASLIEDFVGLLAQVYADHPDFDPSWRVSTDAVGEHQT